MKAIVVQAPGEVLITDVELPEIGSQDVLVKVHAAGLCGSDFHIFNGTYPAKYPLVQGHEFSGEIVSVGSDVTDWKVGQRVTADPNIYCHRCYYCRKGQENMCANAEAIGVTMHGAFAEYVRVPQTQLYALPDAVSYEEGALVEPLACTLYGVKRLAPQCGDTAIVLGAGPMGLLLTKVLKTSGISTLAVVDLDPERVETARQMGASETYASAEEAKQAHPIGFDCVIDATGNPRVIEAMFTLAAKRAKLLQFGCANQDASITINPYEIYDNDWSYIGTKTAVYTYTSAINMIASGRITVRDLVSHVVDRQTLARFLKEGKPKGSLKILLRQEAECDG